MPYSWVFGKPKSGCINKALRRFNANDFLTWPALLRYVLMLQLKVWVMEILSTWYNKPLPALWAQTLLV